MNLISISMQFDLSYLLYLLPIIASLPIFGVAYNKFEVFVGDLGSGFHDLRAANHVLEVYATDNPPSATADNIKTELVEITVENGYPANSDITNDYLEAVGIGTLTGNDITWTASGGSFGPLRYVVLFNETQTAPVDPLIAWWDRGSSVTINDGESFTVDFGANIFTLT